MFFLREWLNLLAELGTPIGVPLVGWGLILSLFGWRLGTLCVVGSYGLIGAGVVLWQTGPAGNGWWYSLMGGTALALLSCSVAEHAVCILVGIAGGSGVAFMLAKAGFFGAILWGGGGVAFLGFTAFSFLIRRNVVVVVTALVGATLVVSGLTAWTLALPAAYSHIYSLATDSSIVVPFLVLVPTVMSYFYQIGDMQRFQVDS